MKETEVKDGLRDGLYSLLNGFPLNGELVRKLSILVTETKLIETKDITILRCLEKIRGIVITRAIFIRYTDRDRKSLLVLGEWIEEQIRRITPDGNRFAIRF